MGFFNWRKLFRSIQSSSSKSYKSQANARNRSRRARVQLGIEVLEDRTVPASGLSPSQDFVSQVYIDLLQRSADPGGLTYWSGQIDHGASKTAVVLGLESSLEYRSDLVNNIYETLLHRQADATGLSNWTRFLTNHTVEQLEATIAGSPEFFTDAGQTNNGFLTALYQDLLNRGVDPSGQASFGHELATGTSRTEVAAQVLASTEYRQDLVQSYYTQFLHRTADPAGLGFWAGQLGKGETDQQVAASISASIEYSTRTPNAPVVITPSNPVSVTAASFTIGGTAEAGSLVKIYSGGSVVGSQQLTAAQPGSGSANFAISVPLTANSVNNFVATATNSAGNQSPAAVVPAITEVTSTSTTPTVTAPANQTNNEGAVVSGVTVTANDTSGATLTYSASHLPSGLTINSGTGAISGTIATGASASSPYTVTVSASNGVNTGNATFTWTVHSPAAATPVVTAPANQANNEGATVSGVTVTATDANNATLTYSATHLPSGLSINGTSGVISGTIATGASTGSPYTVTVTASNGVNTGNATFTWLVDNGTTPVVTAPANQANNEGAVVSGVTVTATDPNNATLTFSASHLPGGLTINSATGVISGTITTGASTGSPYTVTVSASDGVNTGNATFTWLVDNGTTPVVTAPANQTNREGAVVSGVTVTATDPNNPTLTYSASSLPAGLTINSATGVISGTIAAGASSGSPYTVIASASDGVNIGHATFTWVVTAVVVVTAPANQTNLEGAVVSGVTVTATDANSLPLTYSATSLPSGLTINGATGAISGTIAAGASSTSPYTVAVSATDGVNTGHATFTWVVHPVVVVTAPTNQTNIEGANVVGVTATATDANSLPLTFSATSLPSGLTINSGTGTITGTIATGASASSPYTVTVSATDGVNTGHATFTWVIHPVVAVTAPATQANNEGNVVSGVTVTATDANSLPLTYSATNLPNGLTINGATGAIGGTIAAGASTGSPYTVTVSATDGSNTGSATFKWLVDNGTNPVVTAPANQANNEGALVSGVTVTATDTNSAPLTYSASHLPGGLTINAVTGVISGTIATGASTSSPYTVTVSASDGVNIGSASFTWLVDNGTTPVVTAPANQTSRDGAVVSGLTVTATDNNNPTLTYSATNLPSGLTINGGTGAIAGTIAASASASSPYMVTVSASDGVNIGHATFTWVVNPVVVVTAPANQSNREGNTVSGVTATATDANSLPLTFSATSLPGGLTINGSTGVISGTIATGASTSSPYTVTVSATDGASTGHATFTWTVNTVVAVTAPANQTNHEGNAVSGVTVTATDSNNATLTYSATNLPGGLTIDGSTGAISGTIATGASINSPFTVTVSATDGTNTGHSTFTWVVNPVVAVTAPANQGNNEGNVVSGVTVTATDSNNATLTYSASGLPNGLTINGSTGVIGGTIAVGASTGSPYTVTVSAGDGTNTGSASFTWLVDHGNVPVVTAPANQTNNEGVVVSGVTVTATDTNSAPLTFSAINLPSGLTINASTGAISGTLGGQSAGVHTVTVSASDGVNTGTATFTWTVADVTTPVVTPPANQNNAAGSVVTGVSATATDADSDTLTYSATGLPSGLTINSGTGAISGTIAAGAATGSPYTVTVSAFDGFHTGNATFTWVVT